MAVICYLLNEISHLHEYDNYGGIETQMDVNEIVMIVS